MTCQRSFIDVELLGGKGREWSKVPLATGWERVIVNNSCPKGLVEDLNEMKVIKTEMERTVMPIRMLPTWFAKKPSSAPAPSTPAKDRSKLRVGIPKVLNIWTTHQFWVGFLKALGISSENIVFSSDTSEEQGREFGKGRGTVDCCYPVKAMSGHYGELIFGQKNKVSVILSPMIHSLPSLLHGHVVDTVTCTRVMAGPENIKAGFMKERDIFAENNIVHASPFVSLGDRHMVAEQLFTGLKDVFDLDLEEATRATAAGFAALDKFTSKARQHSRDILNGARKISAPAFWSSRARITWTPASATKSKPSFRSMAIPCSGSNIFPAIPI